MKRILLIAVLLIAFLATAFHPATIKADDPGFCIEGWFLVQRETLTYGDCVYLREVYHCYSTDREIVCVSGGCPSNPMMENCIL